MLFYVTAESPHSFCWLTDVVKYQSSYISWHTAVEVCGLRFVLIFYDRSIGDMTLSETPRFITPRVSIYDLLSAISYRGRVNSTKIIIIIFFFLVSSRNASPLPTPVALRDALKTAVK